MANLRFIILKIKWFFLKWGDFSIARGSDAPCYGKINFV
jgi:hypothetical protein